MPAPRQLEQLKIVRESTFGTADPLLSYLHIPPDGYSVAVQNTPVITQKHSGYVDPTLHEISEHNLRGSLVVEVFPELASLIFEMGGLPRASNGLYSYTAIFYDAASAETITHTGLTCESLTLSATSESPNLIANLSLIGKRETAAGSIGAATLPSGDPWLFSDGTFNVDSLEEGAIEGFGLKINNVLAMPNFRDENLTIRTIDSGMRFSSIEWNMVTDVAERAVNYKSLLRSADNDMTFQAVFNYPGTGSPYDTLTIDIGRMALETAVPTGAIRELQTMACSAIIVKPTPYASDIDAIVITLG